MDVDSIENCAIKSEVILTETFSFCGQYDYGDKELKPEPVDYKESFECKEEDISVEQTDVHAAPMVQFSCNERDTYTCNECNYSTLIKSYLRRHIKIHKDAEYKCNECDYKTVRKNCLNQHVKIHTGDEYKCKECDYKTVRKESLKGHVKIHTGDEYKCKECDYKTVRKNYLQEHVKIHTGDEYKCKDCDYKTVRKNYLQEHVKIHTGDEYKCIECDFKTAWQSSLKEHVKKHKGDEYKCKECDYKTVRKDRLKAHVKIHTDDEYKCEECDYKTVWQKSLNKHIKIHTGDEYKCKECDYKTAWQRRLKEHVKIHTGDEYKCKECNYTTVRKNYLKEHIKIHTGDEYKCKECDYKTAWQSSLKEHVKKHTGDEFKCKECDYKTVRENSLKEHVKIHTGAEYMCKECDYKTVRKNSLNKHIKIHSGDEYKCKDCDYKTVWQHCLKNHVKIHTGHEYKCKECDYKTVWKSSVKDHAKVHTGYKYECNECDYKTAWQCSLKEHVKVHRDDKYKCKECDYKTVRRNRLKEHIKIHTGDEYKCKECDYKAVRKNCLQEHIKIHTDSQSLGNKEINISDITSSSTNKPAKNKYKTDTNQKIFPPTVLSSDEGVMQVNKKPFNVNCDDVEDMIVPSSMCGDDSYLDAGFVPTVEETRMSSTCCFIIEDQSCGPISIPKDSNLQAINEEFEDAHKMDEEIEYTHCENRQKQIRERDYCFFCKSSVLNYARHLKRNHASEIEVQKILSLPAKSKNRKYLLNSLRKKGNYIHHFMGTTKPVRKTVLNSTKLMPCHFCMGFYASKQLWRHRNSCAENRTKTTGTLSDSQNYLLKDLLVNTKLRETVFPKMRADDISLVAKRDILICEFGSHYLRLHRDKHVINVTSRKMRELARLLIEIRKLHPSIQNLFQALQPQNFDLIIQAMKIVAQYDIVQDKFGSRTYAMNICTSLKECCNIAIVFALKRKFCYSTINPTEAEFNLKTMVHLLESNWKYEDNKPTIPTESNNKKKRVLIPWTENQKTIVKHFFKDHIVKKVPPKKRECDNLIAQYSKELHNKSWLKIKVFIQNEYSKKK